MTVSLQIEAGPYRPALDRRLSSWAAADFPARLWAKDATLWSPEPVPELADRLGWLDLPGSMRAKSAELEAFGSDVSREGFRHLVVLGMGGSSLAPEVYQAVLGNRQAYPELLVLDSTHPSSVRAVEHEISLEDTIFVVSSKSGSTLETLSFLRYFWDRVARKVGSPGRQFAAVTDAGSSLEELAREREFRRVFNAPPDVGGRYSALTEFGLVPAAGIGVDLGRLGEGARDAATACGPHTAADSNPGLALGAFLGETALAGRDKTTILAAGSMRPLAAWVEQLVAESTGKDGLGILPVGGDEGIVTPSVDRAFVVIGVGPDTLEDDTARLHAAGHPVARLQVDGVYDLGGVMFILETAVAAAGATLGIQPFNQPDVQLAKGLARRAMAGDLDSSAVIEFDALDPGLAGHVATWLSDVAPPEYVGIHAYLPPTAATRAALDTMRVAIRDGCGVATTSDFGPRFLHSTGQLHKGGPPVGRFLQVVDRPDQSLRIPEADYTFDELVTAQALGDYQALRERGQRILRVSLGDSGSEGLTALMTAVAKMAGQ